MKESEVRRWLKKNQDFYVRLYGLQDWDIRVTVKDTDGTLMGTCNAQYEYRQAEIMLASDALDSELDLIETFLHELEHVLLSPFDLYERAVEAGVTPSVKKVLETTFADLNETARSMVGQFRKNALQHNQSRRRGKQ